MKADTRIQLLTEEDQQVSGGNIMKFGTGQNTSVTGFQKTIGLWLKALLTEEGSDLLDRDYGTPFVRLLGSNVTSRADVQQVIEQSVTQATDDIRRYQVEYLPSTEDEILENVRIESIVFSRDSTRVDISVRLENRSGRNLRTLVSANL